jgi:hypothetical protein
MSRVAAALVALAVAPAASAAVPIPMDARAGTCATGTYSIRFVPGRSAVIHAGDRTLAFASLRRRTLARTCPRIPVLPRTSLDDAFLGQPIYQAATLRCRIPEKPGVEVHRMRFQPLGSGLTISIDGHLIVSIVLRPQWSNLRVASLFCQRATGS